MGGTKRQVWRLEVQVSLMAKFALPTLMTLAISALLVPAYGAETSADAARAKAADEQANLRYTSEELAQLKRQVESEPSDAKLRYSYAEALKKSGRLKEAGRD